MLNPITALYAPSDFDLRRGQPLAEYSRLITETINQAIFTQEYTTDRENILLLDNVEVVVTPAVGITIVSIVITKAAGAGSASETCRLCDKRGGFPGAGIVHSLSDGGFMRPSGILIMPPDVLRVQVALSGAAAANAVFSSVTGLQVPRGNLVRA